MSIGQAFSHTPHFAHFSCASFFTRRIGDSFWNSAFQDSNGQMRQNGCRAANAAMMMKPNIALPSAPKAKLTVVEVRTAICSVSAVSKVVTRRDGHTWQKGSPASLG